MYSYLKPTLEDYQDQVAVQSSGRSRGKGGNVATVKRGGGMCRKLLRCLGCDRLAGSPRSMVPFTWSMVPFNFIYVWTTSFTSCYYCIQVIKNTMKKERNKGSVRSCIIYHCMVKIITLTFSIINFLNSMSILVEFSVWHISSLIQEWILVLRAGYRPMDISCWTGSLLGILISFIPGHEFFWGDHFQLRKFLWICWGQRSLKFTA